MSVQVGALGMPRIFQALLSGAVTSVKTLFRNEILYFVALAMFGLGAGLLAFAFGADERGALLASGAALAAFGFLSIISSFALQREQSEVRIRIVDGGLVETIDLTAIKNGDSNELRHLLSVTQTLENVHAVKSANTLLK